MSKLTLHLQSIRGYVADWPADYIKIIDPPVANPFPGLRVIGRTFLPDSATNDMIWKGPEGAEAWFNAWLPFYRARPWVWAWEAPNEPQPMSDASFRAALDAFTMRLCQLMGGAGLRLVGMNWGVGWPDKGHAKEFRGSLRALVSGGHLLGLHEYAAPRMQDGDGWWTLRYRRTVAELRAAKIPVPQIVIGECGIDGGVIGQPAQGWNAKDENGNQLFTDEAGYLEQLQWYDSELKKDAEIVTAAIFTMCDWDWLSFNVTEPLARDLAAYIWLDDTTPEPEPPTPPTPPTPGGEMNVIVIDANGQTRDLAYLRAQWGNVAWTQSAIYGTLVLREDFTGSTTTMIHLADAQSKPISGRKVVNFWPGGSVSDTTNQNGDADFGWGSGSYYPHGETGPMSIQVDDMTVSGLGWLRLEDEQYTNHYHLNLELREGNVEPPPPTTYKLTVTIDGAGSVVVSPLQSVYNAGTVVTLKAVAAPGWEFVSWGGAVTGTANPATVTMNADKVVGAAFRESDEPPPDDDVEQLILEARALLAQADAKLVQALGLLP